MRPRALATIALLSLSLALAGCKGFWDPPSSSGGGGTGTTTLTSGVFWLINAQTQQLIAYYVNAGTLTTIASYAVPSTPIALTVAPNNQFLYVSTIGGIYVYTIASNGTLTLGNSSAPISSDPAQSMQVDATNSWLIEAVSGAADAFAIPINASTGVPTSNTEQTRALAGSSIQQLAISPDNSYVFVAMGSSGTAAIPFNSGNSNPFGTAQTIGVLNTAGSALSVAVDPTNRLFYIGETAATSSSNSGGLRVFTFSDRKEITGSPFATQGLAPYAILPEAASSYVYVANRQINGSTSGLIAGYTVSVSNSTYSLTALGSTFSAGTHTVDLAEDSSNAFIFAVNIDGSPDLNGYVFDTTTAGNLTKVIASTTGTDPVQATAVAAAH